MRKMVEMKALKCQVLGAECIVRMLGTSSQPVYFSDIAGRISGRYSTPSNAGALYDFSVRKINESADIQQPLTLYGDTLFAT